MISHNCVTGVPDEDEDHAHHTVQMGLDMIELIQVNIKLAIMMFHRRPSTKDID